MNNNQIVEKLRETLIPSLFAGAASAALFSFYVKDPFTNVPVGGYMTPAIAAVGFSSAAGDMVGNVISEWLLPLIPKNEYSETEGKILTPIISGASTYLVMRTLISENISLRDSIIIGSGGAVLGKYMDSMLNKDR